MKIKINQKKSSVEIVKLGDFGIKLLSF